MTTLTVGELLKKLAMVKGLATPVIVQTDGGFYEITELIETRGKIIIETNG
jgi:hypothetical protein